MTTEQTEAERVTLAADLGTGRPGLVVPVHDYALDGDEDLHAGKPVLVTDGETTVAGIVVQRDEAAGFWFVRLN